MFPAAQLLFVNSERASLTFVYNIDTISSPRLLQILPAGTAPEGAIALASRNLLVSASELDSRSNKLRSVLNIYERTTASAQYPTLQSVNRADGTPIPFAALSGLAPGSGTTLYSIEDSFFEKSRIFTLDVGSIPAHVAGETRIVDSNGVLASFNGFTSGAIPSDSFDASDLAAMINSDSTVNIDPEGIAYVSGSNGNFFYVASEGSGTIGDASRPVGMLNFIFKCAIDGTITEVITLPAALNAVQLRFGLEGIAVDGSKLIVVLQRAWGSEANPRIGIYDIMTGAWTFAFYPLDTVSSQNGGWVGLSDITPLGNGQFLVLERDNQGGPDAVIKKVYRIDLNTVTPVAYAASTGPTLSKTLVKDLMPLYAATGMVTPEKAEGLAYLDGRVFTINDNDGVDDNSGEMQLISFFYP